MLLLLIQNFGAIQPGCPATIQGKPYLFTTTEK
jgi:hypothetical protein